MMPRRRVGLAQWRLIPCPVMLLLAACFSHPGSPLARTDAVTDVGPWTVSASSPVEQPPASRAPGQDQPAPASAAFTTRAAGEDGSAAERTERPPPDAADSPLPDDVSVAQGSTAVAAGPGSDDGSAPADGSRSPHVDGIRAAGVPAAADGPDLSGLSLPAQVHTLLAELRVERQRRQSAELQLQRLKEETSVPPFGSPMVPEREVLAAKQEIVYLRQSLEEERVARQHLAEELLALQTRVAQAPPPDDSELLQRQEAAATSFTRSLAAGQAESAALDDHLAAASQKTGLDAIRSENAALRSRLEEQHRRTQELGEKLKVATRVADLIFKMEAQPSADGLPPPRPAPKPAARRAATRPQAPPPRSAPSAPSARVPPYAVLDDISGYDPEPPDTPTPRLQPTPTPTVTPRILPTQTPTATIPKRTPGAPVLPIKA